MTRQPDILRRKAGKLRVGLVPPGLDQSVVLVMEAVLMGSSPQKCEDDWFVLLDDPPQEVEREFASAIKRHVLRMLAGEEFDPETGLPHLWHILTGGSIANALLYHREDVQTLWDRERKYEAKPEPACTTGPTMPPMPPGPTSGNSWESDLQEDPPRPYGGSVQPHHPFRPKGPGCKWGGPAEETCHLCGSDPRNEVHRLSWLDTHDGQEATGAYFTKKPTLTAPAHACLGFPCDECRRLYSLEAITKRS